MYELYTRETDPKKRKVIKQYATDEEAAEDLGMSPKRIRQAAAYCKRYWYAGATASYVCLILEQLRSNRRPLGHKVLGYNLPLSLCGQFHCWCTGDIFIHT